MHLVDQRGEPVPGRRFEITLPDGSTRQGFTDPDGWGRVSDFTQDGEAKITFPAFDELDYLSGTSPTKKVIPISAKTTPTVEAPPAGPAEAPPAAPAASSEAPVPSA